MPESIESNSNENEETLNPLTGVVNSPTETTSTDISYDRYYQEDLAIIQAVDSTTLRKPTIRMDIYIGEAEGLIEVLDRTKDTLVEHGFDVSDIELLQRRIGCCRVAQVKLENSLSTSESNREIWKQRGDYAFKFRTNLLNHLRYACRKNVEKSELLKEIGKGTSINDMIHDLYRLADLGEGSIPELEAIKVELALLTQAKELSIELARLQKAAELDRRVDTETKMIRDQAYTLLDIIVHDIRDLAHYVYKDEPTILKMFLSKYMRKKNSSYKPTHTDNPSNDAEEGDRLSS